MADSENIEHATKGRIFGPVDGFYEALFENKAWYPELKSLIKNRSTDIQQFLPSAGAALNLEKLNTHLKTLENDQIRQYYGLTKSLQIPNPSFWLAEDCDECSDAPDWSKVMMVGVMDDKDDPQDYHQGLLCLISLAERVFLDQPTRRFLHGIYIRDRVAEPWLLDRMGLYSGRPLELPAEGARLATLLSGYSRMCHSELGMDAFIREEDGSKFIELSNNDPQRLFLEPTPFVCPNQLLGKGVTCYKAREESSGPWKAVVKFCWKSEKEEMEEKILHLVKERKVWGVIQLLDQGEIESMTSIHHGLALGPPRKIPASSNDEQTRDASSIDSQAILGNSELVLERNNTSDESRVLSYTITSPFGRHITQYSSIKEFLVVLRDAIKAHRSKISRESSGTLIDLDAAVEMTDEKPTRKTITGTKPFMAIGLLQGEENAYRHDLESFFYVFLFSAAIDRKLGLSADTPLQKWLGGSWDDLAVRKAEDLADPQFYKVLAAFQPDFEGLKGLARALRDLFIGRKVASEDDGSQLYDQMLAQLDGTILEQSDGKAQI
ncbi:hypothetical protein FCULG_00004501 [Fusarium culmorum]|uniref:Fungal-type protein kinase domain-containing protein n=1 Tax=Fusarium culmorum TaxID=5516 RepID=A0A2T4H689_FUSCU|nr:hypothetical protein FCULG_00004501 [Fusarium culmorum]